MLPDCRKRCVSHSASRPDAACDQAYDTNVKSDVNAAGRPAREFDTPVRETYNPVMVRNPEPVERRELLTSKEET
jgi:hypothetical protein